MKAVTSFTLFVSLLTSPAAAEPLVCGTSPETQRRVDAVERLVKRVVGCQLSVAGGCDATAAARTPTTTDNQQLTTPTTRFANGMFFVRADETTTPFDDPADLEGISLHFTRKSATTFAITRGPLQSDENVGPLFVSFDRATTTKDLTLPFAFPFGGQSYGQATLSVVRGIHFTKPSLPVTITWRRQDPSPAQLDLQAVGR